MSDTIPAYIFNRDTKIRNVPIKKGYRIIQREQGWVIENGALQIMQIEPEVIGRIRELLNEEGFTEEVKYLK